MSDLKPFKVGDVVQLKSGGPHMTVEGLSAPTDNSTTDYTVFVEWFDVNNKVQSHGFYSKQLSGV